MKIGLMLQEPFDSLEDLRGRIESAERDGFASAWLPNTFGVDAITALAVAGTTSTIELAPSVVPIYPRHASVLAQQTLTAQDALGGRLTLGIGLSHKWIVENMFGYSFDRPAKTMANYLEVLLPLLRGESAGYITLSAPNAHRTPVLLAAMAPRMLRLCDEHTDGTVLWMTGPNTVRNHVAPALSDGKRIVAGVPICVTDDLAGARALCDQIFAVYANLPSYRAMLDKEGVAGPGELAIVGNEDAVAEQIADVASSGVSDFVAAEFGIANDLERTRALLSSIATATSALV